MKFSLKVRYRVFQNPQTPLRISSLTVLSLSLRGRSEKIENIKILRSRGDEFFFFTFGDIRYYRWYVSDSYFSPVCDTECAH